MEIKGKVHCLFEQENWKPIAGFEGLYEVSSFGRIKSIKRKVRANACGIRVVKERILHPCVTSLGYANVVLCKNGVHLNACVHRLVARAFIPNPMCLKEVNHKDENKLNNRVENLEWCDRAYNANYGTGIARCAEKRYKPVEMLDIDSGAVISSFVSVKDAMLNTGICNKRISAVCTGRAKTAGGYKWRFAYGD